MNAPSLHDVRVTQDQVRAVAAMLEQENDEQLRLDMFEGETNLFEIVRGLLDAMEADEGNAANLKSQIEQRMARKSAAEHRNDQRRKAILFLLQGAGISTLPLPEATLSVRAVAPKPIVVDEAAVPESLCRTTRTPDMAAIRAEVEAGRAVSGVTLDNGASALTIRRK